MQCLNATGAQLQAAESLQQQGCSTMLTSLRMQGGERLTAVLPCAAAVAVCLSVQAPQDMSAGNGDRFFCTYGAESSTYDRLKAHVVLTWSDWAELTLSHC